jgi:hypothetical protein
MSTYVNPRPQPVRLVLSGGSERTVSAWGLAFLPDSVRLVRAEFEQPQQQGEPISTLKPKPRPGQKKAA